jgi:hypothetical protein
VEFLEGQLPWRKEKDREKVYKIKKAFTSPELVSGLPRPMLDFYHHLMGLEYEQAPNYNFLMQLMDQCCDLAAEGPQVPYDWERHDLPAGHSIDEPQAHVSEPPGEGSKKGFYPYSGPNPAEAILKRYEDIKNQNSMGLASRNYWSHDSRSNLFSSPTRTPMNDPTGLSVTGKEIVSARNASGSLGLETRSKSTGMLGRLQRGVKDLQHRLLKPSNSSDSNSPTPKRVGSAKPPTRSGPFEKRFSSVPVDSKLNLLENEAFPSVPQYVTRFRIEFSLLFVRLMQFKGVPGIIADALSGRDQLLCIS